MFWWNINRLVAARSDERRDQSDLSYPIDIEWMNEWMGWNAHAIRAIIVGDRFAIFSNILNIFMKINYWRIMNQVDLIESYSSFASFDFDILFW